MIVVTNKVTQRHKSVLMLLFGIIALTFLVAIFARDSLPLIVVLPLNGSELQFFELKPLMQQLRIVLPDDVMITLRAADILHASGVPSLNRNELAQPATSYLYPYFLSIFSNDSYPALMPFVASITGIFSMGIIAWVVARRISDDNLQWMILALLYMNASTIVYLYSGWEHLPQSVILVAFLWVHNRFLTTGGLYFGFLAGFLAALAIGVRVDSLILVLPFLFITSKRDSFWTVWPVFVGVGFPGLMLLHLQWSNFGWLAPTTARLKADGGLDVVMSLKFLFSSIVAGSSFLVSLLVVVIFWRAWKFVNYSARAMLISALIFMLYGIYVSDVFPAARMFIPLMCMCLYVLVQNMQYLNDKIMAQLKLYGFIIIGISVISIGVQDVIRSRLKVPQIRNWHPVMEHLLISQAIEARLQPGSDVIGLFWLGTASYELSRFKVNDFLGKGDEDIARMQKKWGMPGHNKWDIEKSLKLHNPSVIIARADIHHKSRKARVLAVLERKDWAFWDDFYESSTIQRDYLYCQPGWTKEFGMVVRNDKKHLFSDVCSSWNKP